MKLARDYNVDLIMNAVDPIFDETIFDAAYKARVNYMDMAMTLSKPHKFDPLRKTGVKLGDYQFERAAKWEKKELLALVGMGIEPGVADVFAKYAEKHLFDEIDEIGVRDGIEHRSARLYLRAQLLDLDDDRRMPESAGDLGSQARLVHDRAVQRAGIVRVPRRHRAGGSASTWSTKKCCWCRAG